MKMSRNMEGSLKVDVIDPFLKILSELDNSEDPPNKKTLKIISTPIIK